jgi:hypothetical protein
MTKQEQAVKSLSHKQREVYELICKTKHFRAEGPLKRSCRNLFKLGLIKQNPNSEFKNDYVLDGLPVMVPVKIKLPSTKSVVEEILNAPEPELKPKEKFIRPAPDHTNLSREDHIRKWSSIPIKITSKSMVKLKCLNDDQMEYIMANHEDMTAADMANDLKVEDVNVLVFCQANGISPLPRKAKGREVRKHKDSFHVIPEKRKKQLASKNYHHKMDKV